MMKCKACDQGKVFWYSTCKKCGYYQNSCLSSCMYNILKVEGNAEFIYSAILDKNVQVVVVKDCFDKEFFINVR